MKKLSLKKIKKFLNPLKALASRIDLVLIVVLVFFLVAAGLLFCSSLLSQAPALKSDIKKIDLDENKLQYLLEKLEQKEENLKEALSLEFRDLFK